VFGAVNRTTWRLFYSAFRYSMRVRAVELLAPGPFWPAACAASGEQCCDAHALGHTGVEHGRLGGELFAGML